MAEIERATGVPASTLYQWAARGGWRLGDLESETSPIPAERREPRDRSQTNRTEVPERPSAVRDRGMFDPSLSRPSRIAAQSRDLGPEERGEVPDRSASVRDRREALTPESLRAAGEASMAKALTLAAEGRARAAREALLLGQRFLRAAEVLAGAAGAGPEPEPETEEEGEDDPTAELEARLHRIVQHAFKQDEAVAEAIGLEDVRWLDLSAFALPGGQWRRATDAEKARIKAGDWPLGISRVGLVELRYLRFADWGGAPGQIPPEFTRFYGPLAQPPQEAQEETA